MADNDAGATLGVTDLVAARQFYEKTLGLTPIREQGGELVIYRTGHTSINVYHSQFAGTNRSTAVTGGSTTCREWSTHLRAGACGSSTTTCRG